MGLSLGHGGQFCGNPLFKASIYSGKRLSSGRARPKQPHLTSHLKVRLFSFPGCLDWFCCLPILQPPLLTSLGPGVGKNYPLPEKASLKPFPSFFFWSVTGFSPFAAAARELPALWSLEHPEPFSHSHVPNSSLSFLQLDYLNRS